MKKLFVSLLCVVMMVTFMPSMVFADSALITESSTEVLQNGSNEGNNDVAQVGETKYPTLQEAFNAAPDGVETEVLLLTSLVYEENEVTTVAAEKKIIFNMQNKSITVNENYTGGRPIVNEGTLTIKGNGTIDSSASESNGLGAINNKGTLLIKDGTYKGAAYAGGSCIRNTGKAAMLTVENGSFTDATCAIYNEGTAIIKDGFFKGTTCNQCNSKIWSYTLRNSTVDSKMIIDGGEVIGVQGAVSASVGYLEINDGSFKTIKCEKNSGHTAIYYALYAAGEDGEVKCVVNGGTFETEGSIAAAVIGNDNQNGDGGINAQATAYINGGTFKAPAGVPALNGAEKTGDPVITGGIFSSDVSKYADKENGYFSPKNGETYEVVKFGKINAFQEDGTLIGTYDSFRDALAEVNDISKYSGMVKLVCDAGTYIANGGNHIPVTRSILVEGNGAAVVPGTTSLQGEADFAIEESLGQAEGINNLKCDTQIVVEDLYNAAVWGTRKTEYNLTVELNNCDTHEHADKTGQRVYINGTTGKNYITLKNCDIKNQRCTVYSNAAGSINIEDCSFINTAEPININTKAAEGTVSVSVRNTRFLNCGLGTSNDAQWAAPIRVVKTGSDKGKSKVTVDNCIFNYTNGNKPANGDVLIGEGRDGKTSYPVEAKITSTKADIRVQTPGFYLADGSKDETKQVEKTVEKNQTAIITPEKEIVIENEVPPYIPPTTPVQKPTIEAEEGATVTLSKDGTTATIVVDKDATLKDVLLNGKSLGAVTEVPNLKTGDRLVVIVETAAEKNARLKEGVENTTIKLKSTLGKGWIKLNWTKSKGYKVDYYEVYRSEKKNSGYGKKAYFTTKNGGLKGWYKNSKQLKKGTKYYYKVRGVREIAGENVYTKYSNKVWRLVK